MFSFLATNDRFNDGEKTFLEEAASASALTITVQRAEEYSANDFIRIGLLGGETAELRKISSIAGNVITLTVALSNSHAKGEEVVLMRYDQRKLYRETAQDSAMYELVGSAKTIEVDNPNGTIFEDASGSSVLRYKCSYYNSETGEETSLTDSEAVYGGDSGEYCSIDEIRQECGITDNQFISDIIVIRARKRATDEINATLKKYYTLPLSEIPDIIEDAATLLSSGRIMTQQYNGTDDSIARIGREQLREGRDILTKIATMDIVLLDSDGDQLTRSDTGTISGWPLNTTKDLDEEDGGGGRMFTRLQEF